MWIFLSTPGWTQDVHVFVRYVGLIEVYIPCLPHALGENLAVRCKLKRDAVYFPTDVRRLIVARNGRVCVSSVNLCVFHVSDVTLAWAIDRPSFDELLLWRGHTSSVSVRWLAYRSVRRGWSAEFARRNLHGAMRLFRTDMSLVQTVTARFSVSAEDLTYSGDWLAQQTHDVLQCRTHTIAFGLSWTGNLHMRVAGLVRSNVLKRRHCKVESWGW